MTRMKRMRIFIIIVAVAMLSCGCARQELEDMASVLNGEYRAIVWGESTYVPFCAISRDACGKQIGRVDGDKNDRIYAYRGYPSDEWIVSVYVSGLMDSAMLCRKIRVTDIPEGLHSEYAWNP